MEQLRGKQAVVIGGGSGIGRGIALGFAEAGMDVVVADIEMPSAEAVAAEVAERGVRSRARPVDATDPTSLARLAAAAVKDHGAVHVLSNNVGVVIDRPLAECTDRDWLWGIEFNLLSIIRGVAAFLPHLRAHREEAHVVNTASMAGVLAIPAGPNMPAHLGIYTTTKHAIVAYCEMLRGELAPERIGVSVLCPGMVKSNLAATTARNRPERFGGPLPVPGPPRPEMEAIMMPAEQIGPRVTAAIRANRLHVFTHPDARPAVEARQARMLDDFAFAATPKGRAG